MGILRLFFCVVALTGLLTGGAAADDRGRPDHRLRHIPPDERRELFDRMRERQEMRERMRERADYAERNRGGGLSREEAGRSLPRLSRSFDEVDLNRDGVVTPDEVRVFRERRRVERQGMRGDPRY